MLENKSKIVRKASIIALVGNTFIFLMKLIAAYFTSSLAILGDAIDSGGDIGIALMTLAVSFIINLPSNKKYPYGRQRAETIASLILSLTIIMMGFQLLITSIKKLFLQNQVLNDKFQLVAILVIITSIVLKFLLGLNQFILAKKANSAIILANAKNMTNDIILSSSVLIGISFSYYFHFILLDAIVALIISFFILHSGISLFWELNIELMDGNTNNFLYKKLFNTVAEMKNVYNPHRARIRKMANLFDINLDIEVDANTTVYEAHKIAEELTCKIKENIENVYDVVIHIEPHGTKNDEEEAFGLCPKDIKN
ncbi:MAG: cation diffusion facilitator family transporter [Treponema sp.]